MGASVLRAPALAALMVLGGIELKQVLINLIVNATGSPDRYRHRHPAGAAGVGVGSTFSIILPVRHQDQAAARS